ncbi:MAG TPA: hypothetical protein VMY42_01440 [Thermoguttaceae bacterium]|nr:hypothetical protein [Thermoguttaceae bacterium]
MTDQPPQQPTPEEDSREPLAPALFTSPDKFVSDCNLVARWGIRPEARGWVADKLLKIILDKKVARDKAGNLVLDGDGKTVQVPHRSREVIAAVRALASLDRLNMEQEKRNLGLPDETNGALQQTAVVLHDLRALRNELLDDDDYQHYLRDRALQADGHAGDLGADGQPGPVADGTTSGNGRSGPDGDRHGKE